MSLDLPAGPEPAAPESSPSAPALTGIRFLRSFDGREPSAEILKAIRDGKASGVTLFRARNVDSPGQVRELCASLQAARPAGDPPLIVGLDQEGGQLQAVGDPATAWPGNLAIGATGSAELARDAGRAIGLEVAALGGTLVYAPVCDALHRASATPLGTRPFGDDPVAVAQLVAAMTEGLQAAGVAATLKHFPGHGAAAADSHRAMPVIDHDIEALRTEELPPFQAGIAAGALAVLPGHLAVPALTGGVAMPATVSPRILDGLLRQELGFEGVTVSDALDMAGAAYGDGLGGVVAAAAAAGMDLLFLNHPPAVEEAAFESLHAAIAGGRLAPGAVAAARERVLHLRRHLSALEQPPLDVVGCVEHRRLARRIAEESVTLVRDPEGTLPLRTEEAGRIAVLTPVPEDLTPAETSSYLRIGLADALRARGFAVDELIMPLDPSDADVAALASATAGSRVAVAGTFDAVSFAGQSRLVSKLAETARVVAIALRTPYDLELYPERVAAVATYGIQGPQIEALADAMAGRIGFAGRLPVHLGIGR
jgi:beta-N-acetylhexosaminidase